jgi:hypothetical protein
LIFLAAPNVPAVLDVPSCERIYLVFPVIELTEQKTVPALDQMTLHLQRSPK